MPGNEAIVYLLITITMLSFRVEWPSLTFTGAGHTHSTELKEASMKKEKKTTVEKIMVIPMKYLVHSLVLTYLYHTTMPCEHLGLKWQFHEIYSLVLLCKKIIKIQIDTHSKGFPNVGGEYKYHRFPYNIIPFDQHSSSKGITVKFVDGC